MKAPRQSTGSHSAPLADLTARIAALPDVMPGHWETSDGREKAGEYAIMDRAQLALSHRTDFGLANTIFMVDRNDLGLIGIQAAAKDRIRWLSVQLALAQQEVARLEGIEALARELVTTGLVNRGVDRGLVVIEKADRSDPHYRLCAALNPTQQKAESR